MSGDVRYCLIEDSIINYGGSENETDAASTTYVHAGGEIVAVVHPVEVTMVKKSTDGGQNWVNYQWPRTENFYCTDIIVPV